MKIMFEDLTYKAQRRLLAEAALNRQVKWVGTLDLWQLLILTEKAVTGAKTILLTTFTIAVLAGMTEHSKNQVAKYIRSLFAKRPETIRAA